MYYVHLSRVSTVTGSSETALNTGHAWEDSQKKDKQHAITWFFLWHSCTRQTDTHTRHILCRLYIRMRCSGTPNGLPFTSHKMSTKVMKTQALAKSFTADSKSLIFSFVNVCTHRDKLLAKKLFSCSFQACFRKGKCRKCYVSYALLIEQLALSCSNFTQQ